MQGKIHRIFKQNNFGYIVANGIEYFFHKSALKNIRFEELELGQEVEFEEVETGQGWRADDIFT